MKKSDKKLLSDFIEGMFELHFQSDKPMNSDDVTERVLDFITSLGYEIHEKKRTT